MSLFHRMLSHDMQVFFFSFKPFDRRMRSLHDDKLRRVALHGIKSIARAESQPDCRKRRSVKCRRRTNHAFFALAFFTSARRGPMMRLYASTPG